MFAGKMEPWMKCMVRCDKPDRAIAGQTVMLIDQQKLVDYSTAHCAHPSERLKFDTATQLGGIPPCPYRGL